MPDSDHDLMLRFKRGDHAALEELLRRWRPAVERVVHRLVGPRRGGLDNGRCGEEDLVQEVFVRLLSAKDRYHRRFAFSTWIHRLALNVARDALRRKRRFWPFSPGVNGQVHDRCAGPGEHAEQVEVRENVSEALAALPAEQREPLVLRHYGELTFAETAAVLDLPASTVKSRVKAALLELRRELERRGLP